jgi:hypothetical protein
VSPIHCFIRSEQRTTLLDQQSKILQRTSTAAPPRSALALVVGLRNTLCDAKFLHEIFVRTRCISRTRQAWRQGCRGGLIAICWFRCRTGRLWCWLSRWGACRAFRGGTRRPARWYSRWVWRPGAVDNDKRHSICCFDSSIHVGSDSVAARSQIRTWTVRSSSTERIRSNLFGAIQCRRIPRELDRRNRTICSNCHNCVVGYRAVEVNDRGIRQ